jgi:hypothetical protein
MPNANEPRQLNLGSLRSAMSLTLHTHHASHIEQALADMPPALSLGENLDVQPVKLPLFVNAQLEFMAVYLLADYSHSAIN